MKKIVFILGGFAMGGAEHMVYEELKKIDRNKFKVYVLCYGCRLNTDLEKDVENIVPIKFLNISGTITISGMMRVFKELNKIKPDLIHSHMGGTVFAALWCILKKCKLVITVHTTPEKAFRNKIEKLIREVLKLERAKLVAVSNENKRKVKEYYNLKDDKCLCVNNGIDLDNYYSKKHQFFTFINVARHDENKNQKMLILSFSRLLEFSKDIRLFLIGDGPLHENLKDLVNELNISDYVVFTGNIRNVNDYYAVSDVYVQTSHREALPLSILEAMASGLPIISTDVGGIKDVVKNNGILINDNDDDSLYLSMFSLMNESEKEIKLRKEESKRIISDYSSKKMTENYEKIYESFFV